MHAALKTIQVYLPHGHFKERQNFLTLICALLDLFRLENAAKPKLYRFSLSSLQWIL